MILLLEYHRLAKDNEVYSYFFKVFNEGKERELNIEICNNEVIKDSCSCEWGSTWRFSKKNIENNTKCKHIKFCMDILKFLNEIQ